MTELFNYRSLPAYNLDDESAILIARNGTVQFISFETIDADAEFVAEVTLPAPLAEAWAAEQDRRAGVAAQHGAADAADRADRAERFSRGHRRFMAALTSILNDFDALI